MGRYIGPRCKKCRRLGESVCGTQKCALTRRNTPPGMHGAQYKRPSEYGLQLREKQKARALYGIQEKQFRNYYTAASKKQGNTSDTLIQLLESRLDNVVYRAGFAQTRRQARQLVSHGHFLVNGRRCDVPSMRVTVGDQIELRDKSKASPFFKETTPEMKSHVPPQWLTVDQKSTKVTVATLPGKEDFEQQIAINLIVEFYSR